MKFVLRGFMQIDPLNSANALPALAPVSKLEQQAAQQQIVTAVRALNKSELYGQDRQLQFSRDPDTHMPVVKVIQPGTGEVIDQIPAEQVLKAYESLMQMEDKGARK